MPVSKPQLCTLHLVVCILRSIWPNALAATCTFPQLLLAQEPTLPAHDRTSPAARKFLGTKLCGEWLRVQAGDASPAALWWQQQVVADPALLEAVTSLQQEACWHSIQAGGAIGAALLASKRQLRALLGRSDASKHWLKVLRAGGPASQQLLDTPWVLRKLVLEQPGMGRQLLREPAGAPLLQALLREELDAADLLGVCPAYDRSAWPHAGCLGLRLVLHLLPSVCCTCACIYGPALPLPMANSLRLAHADRLPNACLPQCSAVLESALNESDSEKRQTKLETLMGGYSRFSAQPRLQPTRKGGRFAFAQGWDDSLWGVRRHLESTDLRRWPPAVQAQLRHLFAKVAAAGNAKPRRRIAAAIRLARLQASTGVAGSGAVSPASTWQLVLRASTSTCTAHRSQWGCCSLPCCSGTAPLTLSTLNLFRCPTGLVPC